MCVFIRTSLELLMGGESATPFAGICQAFLSQGDRRWDEIIQATTEDRCEAPCQMVMLGRSEWRDLQPGVIACATRRSARAVDRVPLGRHMLAQSDEWLWNPAKAMHARGWSIRKVMPHAHPASSRSF